MPRTGPRPHTRKYPDPIDHKLYTDCMRARAQAWYLGEQWLISESDYVRLWRENDRYLRKGRHNESLCMTRIDYDLPWTVDNIQIITRLEHYSFCSTNRIGKFRLRKNRSPDHARQ